jgi:hypothetical protein
VTIFLNDGYANIISTASYYSGDYSYSICGGDIDGDGDIDLAVADFYSDAVAVLINRAVPINTEKSTWGSIKRRFNKN